MPVTSPGREPLRLVAYTDYKSPYAYVASRPTLALAVEYPLEITWLPYTLRIAEYLGSVENRDEHQWRKVRYAYSDARRYAAKQGLTIKGPKRIFDGYLSSAGMLFAQREGFFASYHERTFDRFWHRELDIDRMDEMREHIASLGGSPDAFERYATDPATRREHDDIVTQAERIGVFGVPSFVFEGELFWGGDRIGLLRERIEQRLQGLSRPPEIPR
jgi:2-hydroxychromene-2-carboxylate isomerase